MAACVADVYTMYAAAVVPFTVTWADVPASVVGRGYLACTSVAGPILLP
jgi:hypothetical protein